LDRLVEIAYSNIEKFLNIFVDFIRLLDDLFIIFAGIVFPFILISSLVLVFMYYICEMLDNICKCDVNDEKTTSGFDDEE